MGTPFINIHVVCCVSLTPSRNVNDPFLVRIPFEYNMCYLNVTIDKHKHIIFLPYTFYHLDCLFTSNQLDLEVI